MPRGGGGGCSAGVRNRGQGKAVKVEGVRGSEK